MFYLPNDVIRRVLDGVTALAAPGSVLGFDIVNGEMLLSPWTRPWVDMQAAAGWTLPVIPTTMPAMPHNWFVTAER